MVLKVNPGNLLPKDYRPGNGVPYRVRDGDDWTKIAHRRGINVVRLIYFNFKTTNPREVNFYLERNVGCNKQTHDGKNYIFSSSASPGIIYLPVEDTVIKISDASTTFGDKDVREICASGLNPVVRKSLSGSAEHALWNTWFTKLRPLSEPSDSAHYYVYMNMGHLYT